MFNILKANKPLPEKIGIYTTSRDNLNTKLRTLRKKYLNLGWNVLTQKGKIGFLAIDKSQAKSLPPHLEDCWHDECIFNDEFLIWNDSIENQNQLIHTLFTTLNYAVLNILNNDKFTIATKVGLKFRRDFLKKEPILETSSYKAYIGLQFLPSLVKIKNNFFPSFIVRRVVRIKGKIRGTPLQVQNLSKLDTKRYFEELNSLLKELLGDGIECSLSSYFFSIPREIEILHIKQIPELRRRTKTSEDIISEYNEDSPFLEELEEEFNEDIEGDENDELLEKELMDYIFPIIPQRIEYGIIDDPPLWVGRNEKQSNAATMYLLNQFGPVKTPSYKVVFIPIYPENQSNLKDKILKVSNMIVSGSGSGLYDFPGLINRFNLKINLTNPKSFPLNLTPQEFERKVIEILEETRKEFPNLPLKFRLNELAIPFFFIGFDEQIQKEWGKYTPLYQYFKGNLIRLGYPNQIITRFSQFLGQWKTFPLWSISTSIFAKIGGIPWQVDASYTKNDTPIDAIIGYRFARGITNKEEKEFILGIATIFTGNGRYLGFKTKNILVDDIERKYSFIYQSHGYSRRYEGLKIPRNEVKNLFFDAIKLMDKVNLHQENPGAIIIHRLGSVSSEEADAFLECFNLSKFSSGALVSMSEFSLKWNFNNRTVNRGTWINLDQTSGLIFPQGISEYFQGSIYKNYAPKAIPNSFKIKILRDTGVYNKPHEAGYDIMALSRMNWRHTTYTPSNYPISLQYSLIIAQNIKNNIIPLGDLNETPWFL